MGLIVLCAALGLVGGVGVYLYGRALYRIGYWRGWEARQELEMRIDELRAEESIQRAGLYAGLEVRPAREGGA